MKRTRRADPRKADHPVPLGAESRSRPTDDWLAPLNLMNEWQKEGYEGGFQEGFQKGFQEGFQEGLQEGLQDGRLEVVHRFLGIVLRTRFGDVPEATTRHLETLQDRETLDALLELAASCASLADFQRALPDQA